MLSNNDTEEYVELIIDGILAILVTVIKSNDFFYKVGFVCYFYSTE